MPDTPLPAELNSLLATRSAQGIEGKDYDLEKMLPFWHLTNEQDWDICKWQQKGVDSIGYEPGPLSTRKEYNVDAFIRWYLQEMRGGAAAPQLRIA